MKEDFLQYVWKFAKFKTPLLFTTQGETLQIISLGQHNQTQSGPDFFNAQIELQGQRWAGNVEVHLKSSDWYAHGHEKDFAYHNVILHVVWQHDMEVYRSDETPIPTLVLSAYVQPEAFANYQRLMQHALKWIPCEGDFKHFSEIKLKSWLERVFIERLEEKALQLGDLLKQSNNHWEEVFFKLLLKNFGLKINGEAFLSIAQSIPYAVFQKCSTSHLQLEALLLGQAHLLERLSTVHPYVLQLQKEYAFLKQKFQLHNKAVLPVQFYGARPTNFPTIRLAQFAALYHQKKQLFNQLLEATSVKEVLAVFDMQLPDFWQRHYTFEKESKPSAKKLSKSFIHLLIINTLVPVQFTFAKFTNHAKLEETCLHLLSEIPPEVNYIVKAYHALRPQTATNAVESQALLQLHKNYCAKHQCLQCNLGIELLGR